MARATAEERFMAKVSAEGNCWRWGTKLRLYRGDASAALAGATLTANSTIELSGWMELT